MPVLLLLSLLTVARENAQTSLAHGTAAQDNAVVTQMSDQRMQYRSMIHGFSFEYPASFRSGPRFLSAPGSLSRIWVTAAVASQDPKFYLREGAVAIRNEIINGRRWVTFALGDKSKGDIRGGEGYYTFEDGIAVEFLASPAAGAQTAQKGGQPGTARAIASTLSNALKIMTSTLRIAPKAERATADSRADKAELSSAH